MFITHQISNKGLDDHCRVTVFFLQIQSYSADHVWTEHNDPCANIINLKKTVTVLNLYVSFKLNACNIVVSCVNSNARRYKQYSFYVKLIFLILLPDAESK